MRKAGKSTFNVAWHRTIHSALVIVPLERDTSIASAAPIFLNMVVGFERGNQMVSISLISVFDSKVINNQTEVGITLFVVPRPGVIGTGS